MSDWDFLHDMINEGYSSDQIADAAACGYNPDEVDMSTFGHSLDKSLTAKGKVSHSKINLEQCRIIFFDLEFYVPENSRTQNGFCYNPWDKKCKLLGGSFYITSPSTGLNRSGEKIKSKIKSLWLWNYESEKALLIKIYRLLKNTLEVATTNNSGSVSPLFCGIGITTSDVPIIFELFKRYKILSNTEAFTFQTKFRSIDLSQLAIPVFNSSNNFLYPKTKKDLLIKYFDNKIIEDGRSVWELFESQKYKEIEIRVEDEIMCTYICYKSLKSDFDKYKSLERSNKRKSAIEVANKRIKSE